MRTDLYLIFTYNAFSAALEVHDGSDEAGERELPALTSGASGCLGLLRHLLLEARRHVQGGGPARGTPLLHR